LYKNASLKHTSLHTTLIDNFADGDRDAFALIYDKYQRAIYNNICKLIFDEDTAQDILQEVFLKLWHNRQRFKEESELASWLFTVSYNQSISHIRALLKEKEHKNAYVIASTAIYDETEVGADLKLEVLSEAISRLPSRRKQVFELCKLQGKTYAETAAILGIAPDTVKEQMTAALKFVKAYVLSHYSPDSAVSVVLISFYLQ
jgi:RNA polymerase sigma-70 factor (family 1)